MIFKTPVLLAKITILCRFGTGNTQIVQLLERFVVAEYLMTSSQPEITCGFTSVQMGLWRSEALRCHIPHMILRMVSSLNHIPPKTAGRRQAAGGYDLTSLGRSRFFRWSSHITFHHFLPRSLLESIRHRFAFKKIVRSLQKNQYDPEPRLRFCLFRIQW